MNEFDLERLGDVWRRQPDPAEMEKLQRTAAAVSRQARRAQIVDLGAAVLVAGVVIVLVLSNPRVDTFLMGGAAIGVLLYSLVRQRQLRAVELRSLTGGTEDMLDQSIERVEATLKRHRFSFIIFFPAAALGVLLSALVAPPSGKFELPAFIANSELRVLVAPAFILFVAVAAVYLVRNFRASGRELNRLKLMRDAYRREDETTTS